MTDVKHPLTTTTTSTATASSSKRNDTLKQPSSSTTLLQSKLQRGRQLIERNSITKNGTLAMYWAEMENVIMQIFDITADMLNVDITPLSPLASLDIIALLSISNKFSQLTRSLAQLLSDNEPVQWRQRNPRRWAGSKRTQEQQQRHVTQCIADIVRKESNIMLEQLQALRDFVSQHGRRMDTQQEGKHRATAESIQHLLISHANNLVDTLVAFFISPAFIALENKLELDIHHHHHHQQQPQHFSDNGSTMLVMVQDAVVGYDMTRDSGSYEIHKNHDQQEDTGKSLHNNPSPEQLYALLSAWGVGRRFFRSISSFKSQPASTMTSVAPNSTTNIADTCSFDPTNNNHQHYAPPHHHHHHHHHRPPTPNDASYEFASSSTPKNGANALKLLFSNRWGSHTPAPKKSRSLKDMFYTQLSNASMSSHKQRKGSLQDASIYDNESATLGTVSGYYSCSASINENDDPQNSHVDSLSGQLSYQPNNEDPTSSLPSPPPSAKNVSKIYHYQHHHHPPPLARVPKMYQDPMPSSSSEDTLVVSASESSIRTEVDMDPSNHTLSISTSHPTGLTIDHPETSRLPRSPSTLSAIHTEHAQPTFVSSQPRPYDNPHVIPEDVSQQQQPPSSHLAPPPPPPSTIGATRSLKHFRSESDLARLKNMFTPTSTKGRSAHDRHPKFHPQQQSNTGLSSARMSPTGSNSTTSSNSTKTLVPQRTSSLHSSTSTVTVNSANDKDSSSSGGGDNHSWGLLRSLRKNYSSVNLRQAAKDEALRETSFDTTSLYGYSLGKSMPSNRHDSTIHVSENGHDVLIMESVCGKTEVVAGTQERLFARLADEGVQDLDYVDTYILNHSKFTSSADLLENLMARFHMETLPDSQHYSKRCIQVKVLNVISRWVKLQYFDFKKKGILQTRLEAFLNGDVERAGFSTEAKMIKDALNLQISKHSRRRHSLLAMSSHSLTSFGSNRSATGSPPPQRRTSPTTSIFSFAQQSSHQQPSNMTTPPTSPMSPIYKMSSQDDTTSILLSTDSKYIARYLTLADFYLLKCITGYDYLNGLWRRQQKDDQQEAHDGCCYIDLMTKRANMLTHWIMHELLSIKGNKQRRTGLRRVIDIAKHCVEWNNYHTAMVITMGLASTPVQRMQETWESLSSRDMNAYMSLQRLLDVSNNMSHYRQAFSKKVVKKTAAPAVPFFPLVLKDLTFYMDGTPTMKQSSTAGNVPLINFVKFRAVTKFVQGILSHTHENYWFAGELDHLAFFPGMHQNEAAFSSAAGPLDPVAEAIEYRLRAVVDCYNDTGCHVYSSCT